MAGPLVLADHQHAGRVNMVVKPGSAGALFMGWFSAGFFGLGGIAGGIAMMALSAPAELGYGIVLRRESPELMAGGIITLAAGVAIAVIGVVVGVNNNTRVTYPDETN